MKKLIVNLCFLIPFLLVCCIVCAQVNDAVYVRSKPKATLYLLSEQDLYNLSNRVVFSLLDRKEKILKNGIKLQVYDFTNYNRSFNLDAYIVLYKDRQWLLRECDVLDNTILDIQNGKLDDTYKTLLNEEKNAKNTADSVLSNYIEKCKDSIRYYLRQKNRIPFLKDSIEISKEIMAREKLNSDFNQWYDKQSKSIQRAASILNINKSRLRGANSAGGCDYELNFTNMSKKTIKYLDWYGIIYNRVNDPIECEIRRTGSFSGRCTGPIGSGVDEDCYWDCVIYNNSAATIKINKIRIEYIDGTTTYLNEIDIEALINAPSTDISSMYNKDAFFVYNTVVFTELGLKYDDKIKFFEKEIPQTKDYNLYIKAMQGNRTFISNYERSHNQLKYLREKCESTRKARFDFEQSNFIK